MKALLHVGLVMAAFITMTFAGVQWLNRDPFELANFSSGVVYALLMITMLLSHEMGHYLATRYHSVNATLPFFIPFPSFLFLGLFPFGTLGAIIRLKEPVRSRVALFDIGVAGPLAGVVASLIILAVGYRTLPPRDFLNMIHPEYATMTSIPEGGLTFGTNLLYTFIGAVFARQGSFVPPMNEIYHYPFLCVGWFGLFVTAMNLIPIGQLDGGHIVNAMFSNKTRKAITISFLAFLVLLGTAGLLPLLGLPGDFGWGGWLIWGIVLAIVMRRSWNHSSNFEDEVPIGAVRTGIGWLCMTIFALTFSPVPFSVH